MDEWNLFLRGLGKIGRKVKSALSNQKIIVISRNRGEVGCHESSTDISQREKRSKRWRSDKEKGRRECLPKGRRGKRKAVGLYVQKRGQRNIKRGICRRRRQASKQTTPWTAPQKSFAGD